MKIKEIHDLFDFFSDKDQTSYLSPEEKDIILDRASMWLVDELKKMYGEGIDNHESMAPFVRKWDFEKDDFDDDGYLSVPAGENFMRLSGITIIYMDADEVLTAGVEIVNDDDLPARLKSQLNKVSVQYPVGTVEGIGKWKLYPDQVSAGYVKFLKRPEKPFFKYTMSGRTVTQDVNGSVDLEWGEGYINQVIFKALTMAGFKLTDNWLTDAGMAMSNVKP